MLDHLHRADDIEKPRLLRQLLDRGRAIGELGASLLGMIAGGLDRGGRRIDADDVGAQPRQRLGEQPGPAADVQEVDSGERRADPCLKLEMPHDQVARPADPDRIYAMERRHRAFRIPPCVAKRLEARDLLGHDARRRPD